MKIAIALGAAAFFGCSSDRFVVGASVPVELTVVASDSKNLACAAPDEVSGRRCAFTAPDKARPDVPRPTDPTLLQPHTTTSKRQILASGLWGSDAMKGELPPDRFTVRCAFTVEAIVERPSVRWAPGGQWFTSESPWPAGVLSGCTR